MSSAPAFLDTDHPDADPASDFSVVLDEFRDQMRDSEAALLRMHRRRDPDKPRPYDPAAVFSEHFGKAAGPAPRHTDFSRSRHSVLAIIEALFAVSSVVDRTPPPTTDLGGEEEPDPTAEEDNLIPRQKPPPEVKVAARLHRAVKERGDGST